MSYRERERDRYGDRDRGDRYGDRDRDRYGDRGDRYSDRGDRYSDRHGDRYGDRYGDRDRGDRYGDRGDRRDRYGDRDRYGGGRDRYENRGRYGGDRYGSGDRRGGRDRESSGPPDISDTYSLLVLNITFQTKPQDLKPLFEKYGKVVDCYIPRDRNSGVSRGFAFVRYKRQDEAEEAIERLDGKVVDGREIAVQFAKYGRHDEPM